MCIVRERRPAGFLDMKCQTCFSKYAVGGTEAIDSTWIALVSEMESSVCKHDRSAIVTSIAKAVFDVLQEVCQCQESSESPMCCKRRCANVKNLVKVQLDMLRAKILFQMMILLSSGVSGFALYSCIQARQNCLGKQRSRYIATSIEQFEKELWMLKKMKAVNKSFIPPLLKFQDRGCMVFMHPAMLPFGHCLFATDRSYVNYKSYQENGPDIFTHVHGDKQLLASFNPLPTNDGFCRH